MQRLSSYYATVIKSVPALLLALNALGWAAHVAIPAVGTDGAPSTHLQSADQQRTDSQAADSKTDELAHSGDHCGHASVHHTGLVPLPTCFVPARSAGIVRVAPSHYDSVRFQPPLDPPIA